ncbi:MAG: helix-turn-helix transcriptional regulator [Clostridia bacterium]|nr:helix-turn-helix transcriptional regulator [Clostridia bacterium]
MSRIPDDKIKCPVKHTLDIIGGKWKARILSLLKYRALRTGEIKRAMGNITDKVLSDQLKELQNDGLIDRHDYKQIPPKVDYTLTPKGKSLLPIIDQMTAWGMEDMKRKGELPPEWDPKAHAEKLFASPRAQGGR